MSQNENQILEFPSKKSLKARMLNQSSEKKSILSISLASVFLVTLVLNEWIKNIQTLQSENHARGVASIELKDFKKEQDWEQRWAKELSANSWSDQNSRVAMKPSEQDNFIYAVLEGKYSARFEKGHLVSLDYNGTEGADKAISPNVFLGASKKFLHPDTQDLKLISKDSSSMVYEVVGSNSQALGQVEFTLNNQGFVQTLKASSIQK